jgi:hypothetical protein
MSCLASILLSLLGPRDNGEDPQMKGKQVSDSGKEKLFAIAKSWLASTRRIGASGQETSIGTQAEHCRLESLSMRQNAQLNTCSVSL